MEGGGLDIISSGTVSIISLAADSTTTAGVDGITMTAVEDVSMTSTARDVSLRAGIDDVANIDGIVVLGHQDASGLTVADVQSGWVGGFTTLGFFGLAPVVQPVIGGTSAVFVGGAGTPVLDDSTFDGYTLQEIVSALRELGLLA
jgi:hypothetical protein